MKFASTIKNRTSRCTQAKFSKRATKPTHKTQQMSICVITPN